MDKILFNIFSGYKIYSHLENLKNTKKKKKKEKKERSTCTKEITSVNIHSSGHIYANYDHTIYAVTFFYMLSCHSFHYIKPS